VEPDHTPRPVTIADAARRLGLPRGTVAAWANRGWEHRGHRRALTIVDHNGRNNAARYWLNDITQAELEIGLNREHSHRRQPRWQKIQQDRLANLVAA
jgi:hypothetical protein